MSEVKYYKPNNFPPVIKNLLIINIMVWIAQIVFNKDLQLTEKLALYPVDSPHFRFYQVFTHMFAHAAVAGDGSIIFYHILFNMFTLWMFGRILENVWGSKRFLFFYLLCGIGAAACHLLIQHLRFDPHVIQQINIAIIQNDQNAYDYWIDKAGFLASAVGASGAIMGLLAAFGYLFPNSELFIFFIPVPVKAKWAVLGMVAIDLFGGMSSIKGDDIAHFAHLGGAITGFIIVFIWNKTNRKTLY